PAAAVRLPGRGRARPRPRRRVRPHRGGLAAGAFRPPARGRARPLKYRGNMAATSGPRPDYGIDAPRAVSALLALGGAGGLGALGAGRGLPGLPGRLAGAALAVLAADLLAVAAAFLWYSRAGKLRQRDRLLGLVPWGGDETVLDVGCGRALLLIGAA